MRTLHTTNLSCRRYADLYPQIVMFSDVKASELLCSSADLRIC